jgi:hypothetical protein
MALAPIRSVRSDRSWRLADLLGLLALSAWLLLSGPGVEIARADGGGHGAKSELECSAPQSKPLARRAADAAPQPPRKGVISAIQLTASPNAMNVRPLNTDGMNYRALRPGEQAPEAVEKPKSAPASPSPDDATSPAAPSASTD